MNAEELRKKQAGHADAVVRAREQLAAAEDQGLAAKAECESLTKRLAALHREVAEVRALATSLWHCPRSWTAGTVANSQWRS